MCHRLAVETEETIAQLRGELAPAFNERTFVLPTLCDTQLALLTEAIAVAATRVSGPKSPEWNEFINNQTLRVVVSLLNGTCNWDYKSANENYSEVVVFVPPVPSTSVFEQCVNMAYDAHDTPNEHRASFNEMFDLWVSARLAESHVLTFIDEQSNETSLFPRAEPI